MTQEPDQRGMNVFTDLARDCEELAVAVRAAGNSPMTPINSVMLTRAVDQILESLEKVTRAGPQVGERFDVAPADSRKIPEEVVRIDVNDDIIEGLESDGYFEQFNPYAAARARAALRALDGDEFRIQKYPHTPSWTPVELVDIIATVVQAAITGTTTTDHWLKGETQ